MCSFPLQVVTAQECKGCQYRAIPTALSVQRLVDIGRLLWESRESRLACGRQLCSLAVSGLSDYYNHIFYHPLGRPLARCPRRQHLPRHWTYSRSTPNTRTRHTRPRPVPTMSIHCAHLQHCTDLFCRQRCIEHGLNGVQVNICTFASRVVAYRAQAAAYSVGSPAPPTLPGRHSRCACPPRPSFRPLPPKDSAATALSAIQNVYRLTRGAYREPRLGARLRTVSTMSIHLPHDLQECTDVFCTQNPTETGTESRFPVTSGTVARIVSCAPPTWPT